MLFAAMSVNHSSSHIFDQLTLIVSTHLFVYKNIRNMLSSCFHNLKRKTILITLFKTKQRECRAEMSPVYISTSLYLLIH